MREENNECFSNQGNKRCEMFRALFSWDRRITWTTALAGLVFVWLKDLVACNQISEWDRSWSPPARWIKSNKPESKAWCLTLIVSYGSTGCLHSLPLITENEPEQLKHTGIVTIESNYIYFPPWTLNCAGKRKQILLRVAKVSRANTGLHMFSLKREYCAFPWLKIDKK